MHNNFFINKYLYRLLLSSRVKSSAFIRLNMSRVGGGGGVGGQYEVEK